jgi:hypothetical protein
MALAQLSVGYLALTVFKSMGIWSLALMCVLLLLVRQSYSLLAEISDSYLRTVEVLVEAAEGIGSASHGHADRSASLARSLAVRSGFSAAEIQYAGYAALLCAVGTIGGGDDNPSPSGSAAKVVGDIPFFAPVANVLKILDEGEPPIELTERQAAIALVVALAQEMDLRSISIDCSWRGFCRPVVAIASLVDLATRRRVRRAALALGYDHAGILA